MKRDFYKTTVQYHENGKYQMNWTITKFICKRKYKRYLRRILTHKFESVKIDMVHIHACDPETGKINRDYVEFITNTKEIKGLRL